MNLKTYIKDKGHGYGTKFAGNLGIHPVYLSSIIHNRRLPSSRLALRIEEATDGQVTLRELLFPENE